MCYPSSLSFNVVIDFWPSPAALSDALNALGCSVKPGTIKQWRRRDSVAGAYFAPLARACADIGHPNITEAVLAEIAARGIWLPPSPPLLPAVDPAAPAVDLIPAAGAAAGAPLPESSR